MAERSARRSTVGNVHDLLVNANLESVQKSHFWSVYRASRTYRLTLHLYSAKLYATDSSSVTIDPYLVVFLQRDREGTKQKTAVVRRTLEPEWNRSIVFSGLDYLEQVRIEVKTVKQFQDNPLLCAHDFVLRDAMHQYAGAGAAVLPVQGEKISGEVIVGFEFDPPMHDTDEGRLSAVGGVGHMGDDAYVSVSGNFACLLLDSPIGLA